MALDTNIAMGVRPIQVENPMNQMAQLMQLRQAQQGFEEQNALKQALSQGADINDKATFNRIAGINPKLAIELRSKEIETQQKQAEIGLKRADYLGAAYGGLVKNPTLDNAKSILDNAVSMGVLTPQHRDQLYTKLEANPTQIAALAQQGVDASISAKEKMVDATSRANNAATVGAAMYGHNVSAENNRRTNEAAWQRHMNPTPQIVNGENGFYAVPPRNPANAAAVGIAQPVAPDINNTLASTVNPATSSTIVNAPQNALVNTPASAATAPANAAPTPLRPPMNATQQKEKAVIEKIPEAIAMSKDAIRKIDEMIGGVDANGKPLPGAQGKPHPGFEGAVGAGWGMQYVPGTEARGFRARHEEVLGQAFLDAYETLKGGGAITDIEGAKATKARSRMDLATSEKEYMEAAREFQGVLRRGIANAEQKLQKSGGGTLATPSSASAPTNSGVIDFGSLK